MDNQERWTHLTAKCFGGAMSVAVLVLLGLAVTGGTLGYAAPELLVLQLMPLGCLIALPLIALGHKLAHRCGMGESLGKAAKSFAIGALLGVAILLATLVLMEVTRALYAVLAVTG